MKSKGAQVLLTYGQVHEPFLAGIGGKKEARWRYTGPLKGYFTFHKVSDDDLIVEASNEGFEKRLKEYCNTLQGSTEYNHRSALRYWWHSFVLPRLNANGDRDGLPADLADAILQAMSESGLTMTQLASASGVCLNKISDWTNGRRCQPENSSRADVEALEKVLNRVPGTFTRRCWRIQSLVDHTTEKITAARRRRAAWTKATYFLHARNWPDRPRAEFQHLVQVATGTLMPSSTYISGAFWKDKPNKKRPEEKVPTARKHEVLFEAFFGYCVMMGVSHDHLTIALVQNLTLVLRFFEFLRTRNGLNFLDKEALSHSTKHVSGNYTTTISLWGGLIAALLRPGRGYLWQISGYSAARNSTTPAETYLRYTYACQPQPEVFVVAPDGSTPTLKTQVSHKELEWRQECAETHAQLTAWLAGQQKRQKIRRGTEAFNKVEWIIELDRPLDPLVEAVKEMRMALPPLPDAKRFSADVYKRRMSKRAERFQDMVMFELEIAVPLRPENLRELTFRGDAPNLFNSKGSNVWWMKHKEWEKKNGKDCAIELPTFLAADLQELITVYRPFLLGEHTDYLFRPTTKQAVSIRKDGVAYGAPTDPNAPVTGEWLRRRWYSMTRRYIGNPGFGPYMMRHIVTTAWLLENPDGLLVAAAILDDEVQQVIDTYGHVRKHELYRQYRSMCEVTFERCINGSVAHEPLEAIPVGYLETVVTALGNAISRRQTLAEVEAAMKALLRRAKVKGR